MTKAIIGSAALRYDAGLGKAHHYCLPPGYILPQPTRAWPPENVVLLERYQGWLLSGGTNQPAINRHYIPVAGHALGLNLKPHPQLDIDADLNKALDYIKAKRLGAHWTDLCRTALEKFRFFLRQERGQIEPVTRPPNPRQFYGNLPDWLIEQMERYQHLRQRNWRQSRLREQTHNFWGKHTRFWRWFCDRYPLVSLADIKRQHLFDYVDFKLSSGYAAKTVNGDLRCFHAFLLHLQQVGWEMPQALLKLPSLKEPDSLPKFLTDEQVYKLRSELARRVAEARHSAQRRDALLDRAAFHLLWQGGMRLGEVEELRLEDLDLSGRKLMVRLGKGLKDRTVYLTDTAVRALQDYLAFRGMGRSSHVFLYRHLPVHKDLIRCRINAAGERVGVKVAPHRLRHTCATQLLNAGCRVTSIQRFLGHRRLNSTMIYARVHDQTVANDYYAAMAQVEKGLDLAPRRASTDERVSVGERVQLLELVTRLAQPQLDLKARLDLVEQMRHLLESSLRTQGMLSTPMPSGYG